MTKSKDIYFQKKLVLSPIPAYSRPLFYRYPDTRFYGIPEKTVLPSPRNFIYQGLVCIFQALVCTFQALVYTFQALVCTFQGLEYKII